MRKKRKRKSKRKIISLSNVLIVVFSVLASYSVVALSSSFLNPHFRESKWDTLASSTYRIAIAFEQYNEKRFTP